MRTTVTLDPDVAQRIEQEARGKGKALEIVVNDVLRIGLGLKNGSGARQPFRVRAHDFGFKQEVDLDKMNQLADELEAREVSRKLGT